MGISAVTNFGSGMWAPLPASWTCFRAALEDRHQVDTRSKDFLLMKKLLVMSCTNSAFSRVKVKEDRSLFSKKVGKNTLNFLLTLSSSFPRKSGLQGRWTTVAIRVGRTGNASSLFLPEQCGSRHTTCQLPVTVSTQFCTYHVLASETHSHPVTARWRGLYRKQSW